MITIFIGSYSRLETLDRTVASYRKFRTPHELVIVDNGTSHPACQDLLRRLEKEKRVKCVYRLPGCMSLDEVADNFNVAIRDQHEHGDAEWFAVTDADICFDGTHPGALAAYVRLAGRTGHAVGPHLRVDASIPDGYPLRSRVLACETWMLYRDLMEVSRDGVFYSPTQIDTTFHLFPRDRAFDRLRMDPLRVGPPYDAMHLDWHVDVTAPNRENAIYIGDERPVGSWGKAWLRDFWFWFQDSPELAFERLMAEPVNTRDLCNVSFLRSWCYQFGHGVQQDAHKSWEWLAEAIPWPHPLYWSKQGDWRKMIYDRNFEDLGWAT